MTAAAQQLSLDLGDPFAHLCRYGTPEPGTPPASRPCSSPATHAAVCEMVAHVCPHDPPSAGHTVGHLARIECCRAHADYYASAWAGGTLRIYPHSCRALHESVWIEVLR